MAGSGRRDLNEYTKIKAEVFFDFDKRANRVRPAQGEVFPQSMRIECSKEIRNLPVGTLIRLDVVETERQGSKKFLFSSYKWQYELVG